MSYKKRLFISFAILGLLILVSVTFFVIDTQNRFKNINKENIIPQEAEEIFKAR